MDFKKKQYVQSDAVTKAQQAVQKQQTQKPGVYTSQHQQSMNDVLDKIQNREKFGYNINEDALYQQAAQNYINQGKMAMMDTMGQAATLTGGYGNSYAQQAGQQAYQGYLQGLTDLTPQYYQMALDRYKMEGDDLLDQYALLQQQEDADYGRYQDEVSRHYTELDRLQSALDNERAFDYGQFADGQAYDQWAAEFEEDMRRYNQEWAELHPEETASSGGSGGRGSGGGGGGGSGWGKGVSTTRDQSGLKGSSWDYTKNNMAQILRTGDSAMAEKYMDQIVDELSESQYNEIMKMMGKA